LFRAASRWTSLGIKAKWGDKIGFCRVIFQVWSELCFYKCLIVNNFKNTTRFRPCPHTPQKRAWFSQIIDYQWFNKMRLAPNFRFLANRETTSLSGKCGRGWTGRWIGFFRQIFHPTASLLFRRSWQSTTYKNRDGFGYFPRHPKAGLLFITYWLSKGP